MQKWQHGTNVYFEEWKLSDTASIYKPELLPHSFISFSQDKELLEGSGSGRCEIKIKKDANIINLLENNSFSEELWNQIKKHPFGKIHSATKSIHEWHHACKTGAILRPHIIPSEQHLAWMTELHTIRDENVTNLILQNFVRHWIEFFISTVRSNGFDGVICNEYTQFGKNGPRTSLNLYIFNPAIISKPLWIRTPDHKKTAEKMKSYERIDIKNKIKFIRSYPYYFSY